MTDKQDRISARRRLIVGAPPPEPIEPPVDPPPEVEPAKTPKRRKGKSKT